MSNNAKPIFIIRLPDTLSRGELHEFSKKATTTLTDYHTLIVTSEVKEVNFECFNCDNITDIDLEELKGIINDCKLKRDE